MAARREVAPEMPFAALSVGAALSALTRGATAGLPAYEHRGFCHSRGDKRDGRFLILLPILPRVLRKWESRKEGRTSEERRGCEGIRGHHSAGSTDEHATVHVVCFRTASHREGCMTKYYLVGSYKYAY